MEMVMIEKAFTEERITAASAMASIEVSLDHLSQLEANLSQLEATCAKYKLNTWVSLEPTWSQQNDTKQKCQKFK